MIFPLFCFSRLLLTSIIRFFFIDWYHPLGLAYYPDGAHDGVPELEEPTPAECDEEDYMCNPGEGVQQAPLYCINNNCETYEDWNNGVTSGLDVYEPVFQRPEDQWVEEGGEGSYAVKITIPEDSKTAEFYYFCHIHSGMSGKMIVEDPAPDANQLVTPLAADYYGPPPEEFDVAWNDTQAGVRLKKRIVRALLQHVIADVDSAGLVLNRPRPLLLPSQCAGTITTRKPKSSYR